MLSSKAIGLNQGTINVIRESNSFNDNFRNCDLKFHTFMLMDALQSFFEIITPARILRDQLGKGFRY